MRAYICGGRAPFVENSSKYSTLTRACAREIDTKRKKGKQIQYKIELLNVCFTNNNQQREQIKHSHTHSGRIQDEENGKKQKLAETNKSTHCNVTEERLSSRRRKRVGGRRLVKYRITLSVTEKERERDSERKRRRMFVCDNILNKKRESKDLSLTDKQNTRENKNQLEINTLEAYDEGC